MNSTGPPKKKRVHRAGERAKEVKHLNRTPARSFWQRLPGGGWRSPIFMSATPRTILQGPPVSRRQQRKLGIAKFVPGIGYAKRPCSRCQKHTWIGPTQLARLEADPGIEVICLTCVSFNPLFKAGLKDGTVAMADLGGRGPEYHMANGKFYGPLEETQN